MKNTPHKAALLFACFMMACSQDVLPQIPPERSERIPTSVELVAAPERLVAGAWGQIEASVLDQFGLAMAGQIINLAVQVEGQTLGLVPALGNTCSTGLEGEPCSVVVRSEGQQGVYNLVLSSSSAAPLSLVIHVDAAPDTAHLFVEMPESTFEFVNGGRDYLINVPPLELALRQAPVEVTLKLLDQYGNPIAAMLGARVLSEAPVAQADAGPRPDAAATDAAVTDAAVADAAATDAAVTDAAATDAAVTDAGTVSSGPRVTLSLGASCDAPLSDSAEAMPNDDGELKLCLSGDRTGAAQIALFVPGVLRVAHADEAQIILRTQTLSVGRHRLIIEGQPQLTCDVGGALEQPLTLRVIDSAEPPNPVPGIEVETSHSGMESVSPAIAISGPDGSLRITGLCPQQRRSETTISAELVVDRTQRIVQPVEVQIGAVAQIIARLENSAPADPWALRIAEVRVLNIELRDERSNTVPQGALSFDLQQAFRALLLLDEPACGAAADASLHALTCIADGAGQIRLRIKAAGILPGEIVNLDLRGHRVGGDDPHLELPLALSTGVPVTLAVNPAREMLALVGSGNGDRIWARIADAGGNGVAGVVVTQREMRLNEDRQLVPQQNPAVTLALRGEGRSDAEGRVLWEISQISRPNDNGQPHQLEFNAVLPGGNRSELLRVSTERGSAAAFILRDLSGDEVAAVEGAWVFNGDAGTALTELHNLTLVNARGGLVQDQLGLAFELLSESAIGCSALADLSAATFEDGIIPFGGNAEVEFNFGQAARSCLYRLSVGEISHELRLEQSPGQPSGGRFEVNIGSAEVPVWGGINNDNRLPPKPGFSQDPQAQPFSQRYDLRVLNPSDAFGNALAAGTTLQPAPLNAWVWPQVPSLRSDGEGGTVLEFSVMAGGLYRQDAQIIASSSRGWDAPPQLLFESEQQDPSIGQIRLRGIDRKAFNKNDEEYFTEGRVRTNGTNSVAVDRFANDDQLYQPDPDNCTTCAAENPNDGRERFLSEENARQAQLLEVTFWGVDGAEFSQTDQYDRCVGSPCSRAVLHWTDDGRAPLQSPQLIGRYPLIKSVGVFAGLNQVYFQTLIPIADLRGGGMFSVAIESDAGDNEVLTSAGKPIFAPLRPWFRPRPLEVLAPPPPPGLLERYAAVGRLQENFRGFARILGVHRIQADNDADEELLICGDDAFGGWIALAQVDESRAAHAANPFGGAGTVQAIRTFYSPGYRDEPLNGDQGERLLPPAARFITASPAAPNGCAYVANGPGGGWVMSFGRPASRVYPGAGDVVATPLRAGQLGTPQVIELQGVPGGGSPAYALGWGSWRPVENEPDHHGLVVSYGAGGIWGFAATIGGANLRLAGAERAQFQTPFYSGINNVDLSGSRWRADCSVWGCEYPTSPGLGGAALEVYRTPGRLIGATDWGGVPGQLRFWRHTPRLAWYSARRFEPACSPENGEMVCPGAVCGDGLLNYAEVCERGPGCSQDCQLEGYQADKPVAGLAVSFAPMRLQDDADPAAEVIISQALAAAPVAMKSSEGAGLYSSQYASNYNLEWHHWYASRASCRRLGGDLPSERQWEGIASGGHGGFEGGPRPHPWGSTPRSAASVYYSRRSDDLRIASTWLGVTPEGLADLTAHAISYGEWTLADNSGKPSGMNAQNGPTAGHNQGTWKGGPAGGYPVRARFVNSVDRVRVNYGVARCVWLVSRP